MYEAPITVFSEPQNLRPEIFGVGGGPLLSGAGDNALTVADVARFGYLLFVKALCVTPSTTVGTWQLKDAVGGTVLETWSQPEALASEGKEYCWPMPNPHKTAAKNGQFAINFSVATMGSWRFNVNGFRSST